MSNNPNAPAKYDIRKNPVYQVDCLTQNKGKRFAATKRRVRWRFGFSNRDAIERGLTGTDCRGAEHEVVFVWSLTSGKQLILADGHEVHWSKSPKHKGKFEFTWNMNGNHEMKVVAHASLFSRRKNAENSDQFDLLIDGLSFWNMPKMFELGTKRSALRENATSINKMSPTSSMDMSAFQIQHRQQQQQQQQQMKQAPNKQYEFAWNDFCDWYVEFAKQKFNNKESHNRKLSEKILIKVLTDVLVMMHPFMPHITEELWHKLQIKPEQILLALQKWPVLEKKYINSQIDKSFQELFEIIRLIRNLRVELGLKPSQLVPVYLISDNVELTNFLKILIVDIKTFTKSSEVLICKSKDIDKNNFAQSFSGIIGDLEVYLPFNDFVNIEALKDRLTKDLKKVNSDIETLNKRISNKNFIDKAPKDIVEECFAKLKEGNLQSERINKKLKLLK